MSSASFPFVAFVRPGLFLRDCRRLRCSAKCSRRMISMKAKNKQAKDGDDPRSPTNITDNPDIEAIAGKYGVRKSRPGEYLDEQYNKGSMATKAKQGSSTPSYDSLVKTFGQRNLEVFEKTLFAILVTLFGVFIAGGLAISSLAYYKAVGKPAPDGWDDFVSQNIYSAFTPTLFGFFILSSIYGLYKQWQLSAAGNSFSNSRRDL